MTYFYFCNLVAETDSIDETTNTFFDRICDNLFGDFDIFVFKSKNWTGEARG